MSEQSKQIILCPICSLEMDISFVRRVDISWDRVEIGDRVKVGQCSICGLVSPVKLLENDKDREIIFHCKLRQLLNVIAEGEKARQLVNLLPLFPNNRTEQLVALMTDKIIAPGVESLIPLDKEEVATVKKILGLD